MAIREGNDINSCIKKTIIDANNLLEILSYEVVTDKVGIETARHLKLYSQITDLLPEIEKLVCVLSYDIEKYENKKNNFSKIIMNRNLLIDMYCKLFDIRVIFNHHILDRVFSDYDKHNNNY